MGRRAYTAVALALAATVAGCGEPLVVLGDAPGVMRIVLGVGDSIGSRIDTLATRTRLRQPLSLVFDTTNQLLYVADRGAVRQIGGTTTNVGRIIAVTSRGRAILTMDAGGCVQNVCVIEPDAMARAPDGALLIADGVGNRVLRLIPGGSLSVVAGTGALGTAADGTRASTAPVARPLGIAVADDGTIYFSEAGAHRVRAIGADGLLRTVAGTGVRGHTGDGAAATLAQVDEPAGLLLHDGELYVAEYGGHTVRVIDRSGVINTIAGVGGSGFAGDGGLATQARLFGPYSLAIAHGRSLYISDQGNDRVRIVDLITGTIDTFAGTGDRGFNGARQAAGLTSLFSPAGVHAASGFLFIADAGHSVVWRTATAFD